jgi:thiamine pyrophosphokinase
MRVLLFANGELPSRALVAEVAALADLVVAADGGADRALACGIVPGAVVGDFDSITDAAREAVGAANLHHAPNADQTDLQKALLWAIARGASRVDIVAAGGGRLDHLLANLSLLVLCRGQADVRLLDDFFEARLVDGEAIVDAPVHTVVSLMPLGVCEGVTTEGLRWDLHDRTLHFSPLGVHNEVAQPPARVRLRTGDLLLLEGRWVEKHG